MEIHSITKALTWKIKQVNYTITFLMELPLIRMEEWLNRKIVPPLMLTKRKGILKPIVEGYPLLILKHRCMIQSYLLITL